MHAVLQYVHMQACIHAATYSVQPAGFAESISLLLLLLVLMAS